MPRAGLTKAEVIRVGAELADHMGYDGLAMAPLAQRLGVKTPSLYKHVASLADLQHGIAVLALTELDRVTRDAMHGLSGQPALDAFVRAFRDYVLAHPGRYTATVGTSAIGPEDPLVEPGARMTESLIAVVRGYGIPEADTLHALRALRAMIHGFAGLQAARGFQWAGDPEDSFAWMLHFLDSGLREQAKS
ncbi:WHG domain-containing protein [Nocardia sp. 2]|uniref:WHG domain-containing protein n=1 Tax=Nocardia acididurans TaxID=2802282 RepID=A0ABS1LZ54_9NOCA|nr:TetR/AcrR family transcriptional regulator [Nocardia acididurans]MBL1072804.1 WHG domain-containing protein [Nocardia acididurans]